MNRMSRLCVLALCAAAAAGGCRKKEMVTLIGEPAQPEKNYEAQLPPGQLALRKITDRRLVPDFTAAATDTAGLHEAVANSLNYLRKPSAKARFPYGPVTHAQAVRSLEVFAALLGQDLPPARLNEAVRALFDVYGSVGYADNGVVLFTGYYTPILNGSLTRDDRFRWPLFRPPADLKKLPDGSPASPMPDRRTIEAQNLYAGRELAWLADPFEAYVAGVQGSARLRLADGRQVTVGYTANNGHPYYSIRRDLVADGKIGKRAGLAEMMAYFRARPAEVAEYTRRNPRFIFFAELADGRPRGCLNEPVTAMRSIATDKQIYPAGCLAFFQTVLPHHQGGEVIETNASGFALDQDAGGAIRAPGRCDVYMGIGDQAGELAGRVQNEGRLYYLFLKPTENDAERQAGGPETGMPQGGNHR